MKKFYNILVISLIFIFAISCKDKVEIESLTKLPIVASNVSAQAQATDKLFIKVAVNEAFTAKSDKEWCTLSIINDSIAIKLTENKSISSRAALISIVSGNMLSQVPILQSGIIVDYGKLENITVNYLAQDVIYDQIVSNVKLNVSSSQTWAKVSINEQNILKVVLEKNTTQKPRQCVITMRPDSGKEGMLNIVQDALDIYPSESILIFSSLDADSKTITVKCPAPNVKVAVKDAWCKAILEDEDLTVSFDKAAEPRSTEVYLTVENVKRIVTVQQNYGYKDLLGTYTLDKVFFNGASHTCDVTIEQLVENESYSIKGVYLENKLGNKFEFIIQVKYTGGLLSIVPHFVGKYAEVIGTTELEKQAWIFPQYFGGGNKYYIGSDATKATMIASGALVNGKKTISFVDAGLVNSEKYTALGFYGAYTSTTPPSKYAANYGYIENPSLIEKK